MPGARDTGMRGRFREQVREDVKRVALEQIAEGGPAAVSVNAIGRELGVSGPALYRYFAGRDALLEALVLDAYADLADALEAAAPGVDRLGAFAGAYRAWALDQPHRYRLLYGPPAPGFDAHAAPLVVAAQRLMDALVAALGDAPASPADPPAPPLAGQLAAWARDRGAVVAPDVALRAVAAWWRLHGLVGLEIDGNFTAMGLDPELLFAAEVAAIAR